MASRPSPRSLERLLRRISATSLAVAVSLTASQAQTHPSGTDYSTHSGGPAISDRADFSLYPIPAGFFDPTSDPFTGTVSLKGSVVGPGNTDTGAHRQGNLNLPPPFPASDTVPIELVSLSLVSVAPIVVSHGGGAPNLWNVDFSVLPPIPGSLNATKTNLNGGTFSSSFFVQPVFTFTRLQDGTTRTLPVSGTLQITGPWSQTPAPNGVSTGPNFYPGNCTLSFTVSGSPLVQSGIAPATAFPVPAFGWVATLTLVGLLVLAGAGLLSRRA